MNMKIILLFLAFSFSLASPPTNCKVCYGHFRIFQELKTDEEKMETIKELIARADGPLGDLAYCYPFEFGMLDLINKKGINYAFEEFNKCRERSSIRKLCSDLSKFPCKDI